jgi:hypothetical protein
MSRHSDSSTYSSLGKVVNTGTERRNEKKSATLIYSLSFEQRRRANPLHKKSTDRKYEEHGDNKVLNKSRRARFTHALRHVDVTADERYCVTVA